MKERLSFSEKRIDKWEDLQSYQIENWLFRGQQCSTWKLQTSLERACEDYYNRPLAEAPNIEKKLIREFQRRYHNYRIGIADPVGIEWISIMQHYGAPTRLLDWSYSIFIAAYFALENPCLTCENKLADCAIWTIKQEWIEEKGVEIFKKEEKKDVRYLEVKENEEKFQEPFYESFMNPPFIPCVLPVNAMKLNERSTIQKGVFLGVGDVTKSFEINLSQLEGFDKPENLKKLIIPHGLRLKSLKMLDTMNISRASLFPGLEGFAQSLKIYHPNAFPNHIG